MCSKPVYSLDWKLEQEPTQLVHCQGIYKVEILAHWPMLLMNIFCSTFKEL